MSGGSDELADTATPPVEGVKVYENRSCHVVELADGTCRVVRTSDGHVVGDHTQDRRLQAIRMADQVAGPPKRPKP